MRLSIAVAAALVCGLIWTASALADIGIFNGDGMLLPKAAPISASVVLEPVHGYSCEQKAAGTVGKNDSEPAYLTLEFPSVQSCSQNSFLTGHITRVTYSVSSGGVGTATLKATKLTAYTPGPCVYAYKGFPQDTASAAYFGSLTGTLTRSESSPSCAKSIESDLTIIVAEKAGLPIMVSPLP